MSGLALARARLALEAAGLDPHVPLERASSVTNEVWLAPEWVVRVNRRPDARLRREAMLGSQLPAAVGYPEVVSFGGEVGSDWLILRRRPGRVLSRCWPSMTLVQRRRAVSQLAERLRALHEVSAPPDLAPIDDAPQLLDVTGPDPVAPLRRSLGAARQLPHVDPGLIDATARFVDEHAAALTPFGVTTLIHGDLTFENVLWDGIDISAVLDLEWARPGPPDLDLDVLLRFCAFPYLHVAEDYEDQARPADYVAVPGDLALHYPELFEAPNRLDRLRLFAVAYDVRDLLLHPPAAAVHTLSPHHPVHRLARTVEGRSHLDGTFTTTRR